MTELEKAAHERVKRYNYILLHSYCSYTVMTVIHSRVTHSRVTHSAVTIDSYSLISLSIA
jgi:hypothetical protein